MVIAGLLVVYDRVRSLAEVHVSVANSHGQSILDLESILHLRFEDAVNTWLAGQGFIRMLAIDYYQYLHVSVALSVLVVCYVACPAAYRPARNALVLTNLVGLAVFAVYPTTPPRLLPGAGFIDLVSRAGFGPSHGLSSADQYGALPSLHMAWATWVAITGFALTRRRVLRFVLAAYPILTAFVVITTGNHYVLDVVSGALLGFAAAWASGLLSRQADFTIAAMPARLSTRIASTRATLGLKPRYPQQHLALEPESSDP